MWNRVIAGDLCARIQPARSFLQVRRVITAIDLASLLTTHEVMVQADAGATIGAGDDQNQAARAQIPARASEIFERAERS